MLFDIDGACLRRKIILFIILIILMIIFYFLNFYDLISADEGIEASSRPQSFSNE